MNEDPSTIPFKNDKDWREFSKCRGVTLEGLTGDESDQQYDLFYPPRGGNQYARIAEAAKNICRGRDKRPPCPVREQCLLYAIDRDEDHGIFGGKSHRERNAMVRKAEREGKPLTDYLQDPAW